MDFATARQNMIDCQLATNRIINPGILDVVASLPREHFLPNDLKGRAYLDEDIQLDNGRILMEPMVLIGILQALRPTYGEVALDVGGAPGYSTALLASLLEAVFVLETLEERGKEISQICQDLGVCNIVELTNPLNEGYPEHAPYDVIFLNGAVAYIPLELVRQLRPDTGRMGFVFRPDSNVSGQAVILQRTSHDIDYSLTNLFDASIPYLTEFIPKEHFAL